MLQVSAVQYSTYYFAVTLVLGVGYRDFFDGLSCTGLRELVLRTLSSFLLLVSGRCGDRRQKAIGFFDFF